MDTLTNPTAESRSIRVCFDCANSVGYDPSQVADLDPVFVAEMEAVLEKIHSLWPTDAGYTAWKMAPESCTAREAEIPGEGDWVSGRGWPCYGHTPDYNARCGGCGNDEADTLWCVTMTRSHKG